MYRSSVLGRFLLVQCLTLSALPAYADCIDTMQICNSSCESSLTSGTVLGIVGALRGNSAAYQQGQRQLQQVEACSNRCTAQYDACNLAEESQRAQEEAARIAQQQRAEAQQRAEQQRLQAEQHSRAEQEKLRRSVNRIVSPPALPALAIKDAAPLLRQAQAHEKDGNRAAAAYIYTMVIKGSMQSKQQQVARTALKAHAIEDLAANVASLPGTYARSLGEYEFLGLFTAAEMELLVAMTSEAKGAEHTSRDYMRKQPNGTLRPVTEALLQGLPQLRVREQESQMKLAAERSQQLRLEAEEREKIRLAKARAAEVEKLAMQLPFDPVTDYESAARAGQGTLLIMVNNNLPISSIGDFVAYVKNNSGRLAFGVTMMQSPGYEALRGLELQLGVAITPVPYKTARDGLNDLIAGNLQAMFASPSSSLDFLRDGRIRVVAKTR